MKQKRLSQEGLKSIACVTMLIDHIGAVIVSALLAGERDMLRRAELVDLYWTLRIIGRIAFPIYCFLLVEGVHRTRDPKKYALRLAAGMVLSELPFDLALNGGWDWQSNSVMVTLLLGFGMILAMERVKWPWKPLLAAPFYLAAEWLGVDYGGNGILLIAMFALTRGIKYQKPLRILGMAVLLWFGAAITIGGLEVPIEIFGILSAVPLLCYSGKKRTGSKWVQWAFYLFYPVHLLVLWLITIPL